MTIRARVKRLPTMQRWNEIGRAFLLATQLHLLMRAESLGMTGATGVPPACVS